MLSIASTVNLNAQTTYKARVINQDTGEPIIGAVVRGNKGVEAVMTTKHSTSAISVLRNRT